MMSSTKEQTSFKICVIGDSGVGKSTFISQAIGWDGKYPATLWVSFHEEYNTIENSSIS